jgi:hypothetical protein
LHFIGFLELAMQSLRGEEQLRQRQRVNPPNLVAAPIVPHWIRFRRGRRAMFRQDCLPDASHGIVAQINAARGAADRGLASDRRVRRAIE